jgi:hypothetical protein
MTSPDGNDMWIKALFRWLDIREQNGLDFPSSPERMECIIRHSALLQRLLAGKEPLPEAPPRAYSYPWYELLDNGCASPREVWIPKPGLFESSAIIVEQERWKIIETVGVGRGWIVAYYTPDVELIQKLRETGLWEQAQASTGKPVRLSASRWRITSPGEKDGRPTWRIDLIPELATP